MQAAGNKIKLKLGFPLICKVSLATLKLRLSLNKPPPAIVQFFNCVIVQLCNCAIVHCVLAGGTVSKPVRCGLPALQ